jgi:hypothetical protein
MEEERSTIHKTRRRKEGGERADCSHPGGAVGSGYIQFFESKLLSIEATHTSRTLVER